LLNSTLDKRGNAKQS
jgi:proton-coupled amino acid transporter